MAKPDTATRRDGNASSDTPDALISVALFVEHEFPLAPLSMVLEALRLVNWVEDQRVFHHWIVSADGQPRASSSEQPANVEHSVRTCPPADIVLVCTGLNSDQICDSAVLNWVRNCHRRGGQVGAISGGAFVLARAGLLHGRTASVHWESSRSLAEAFADVAVSDNIFVIDGRIITCAGGISTLDMMVHLIESFRGRAVARQVADALIYQSIRHGGAPARIDLRHRTGASNGVLLQAIELMERNLEEPVKLAEISARLGTSMRHLERLFARNFNVSPSKYYMRLRLKEAKGLLSQSDIPVVEVALRCGFRNTSHFARRFRELYDAPPSEARRAARAMSHSGGCQADRGGQARGRRLG